MPRVSILHRGRRSDRLLQVDPDLWVAHQLLHRVRRDVRRLHVGRMLLPGCGSGWNLRMREQVARGRRELPGELQSVTASRDEIRHV